MEELEIKVNGIAVDVLSEEWQEEDIINRTPVVINRITKRKGGFTIHMKSPYENIEWYFSKGLTIFKTVNSPNGKILRIEHEDGQYWVDIPAKKEIVEFLKEFMED
ncbi:hypothetical protein GWK41_08245 [Persephonella atlantica]|uniref:Uncharacterized protein n=1 Tax=Persephonella atlantica TaxID=2699429 RepID=A0ABS1GJZ3_9AQUI|nr:hypothetical protein [Persephonella atlantica]MBK3333057.1 hypothetical protein [Persephonella atlantica]